MSPSNFGSFQVDRRGCLVGLGATLTAACAPALAGSEHAASKTTAAKRPRVARVGVVTDTYFGETLSDPYRWMENDKDPDWLPFLKSQDAYTRSLLDALPGHDSLLHRIQQLSGDVVVTPRVQRAGAASSFSSAR